MCWLPAGRCVVHSLLLHSCCSLLQRASRHNHAPQLCPTGLQVDNGQILGFSADLSEVRGRVWLAL